jgi:Flp pilus assembly protein TadG
MRLHTGNRKGQTAVLFTLAVIPLLGMVGLVVDVGWMYFRREAAQTAADAAASAAAAAAYSTAGGGPTCSTAGILCPASPSTTPANNIEMGCLYAKENGFVTAGRQRVTIQAGIGTSPTASGVTINYYVVARVSETIPQLFSAVLGFPNGTVTARATTGTRVGDAGGCVLTLNPTAVSMVLSGSVTLTSGCGVYVNSNNAAAVTLNGGGRITTTGSSRTQIVGNCSGCANISPAAQTGAPTFVDPFLSLNPPTPDAGCQSVPVMGPQDSVTINPGTYCNGIVLSSHQQMRLNPGVYYVRNGIDLGAQTTLRGSGVTIYLETGGVNMSGGATVDLTAPTSGYYQGILFFQARNNTTASTLVGGTGQLMNGVLYFPAANLTYTGGSSTNATQTTIVADTLSMVGNSYISAASTTQFTGSTGGAYLIE